MNQETWTAVDRYINDALVPTDEALEAALQANAELDLPAHDVAPNQGKLLHILARMQGATNILEIGTLGGYSTIWLARALRPGGKVVTLESESKHAQVAKRNIARAGLGDCVDVYVGPALDSLEALAQKGAGPFDLIFIDADKPNNPAYLAWALKLSRPGTLIVGDNVVRDGAIANQSSEDARVQGVQRFFGMIAAEPRLIATAIQTVGAKGYDGFAMALFTG
jgi:predicted O-methyltransferase YrrM